MTATRPADNSRLAPLAEFPYAPHYAKVGRWWMHYVDEGPRDAPAVLLLHGNPTWSYFYRHLIRVSRERFRVIAPDHIGMGRSAKPAAGEYPFTLARRVDDVAALVEAVIPHGDIALVAHDWGGMIGAAWATEQPDRVRRLAMMNTAAFRLPAGAKVPWQLRVVRTPLLGKLLVQGLNGFSRGAVRSCVCRPLPRDVRHGYLAPYGGWAARLAVLRFVEDIPLRPEHPSYSVVHRTEERLPRLADKPLWIGWGLRDFVFREAFLHEWQRHFPRARVRTYPQAGHYLLEDARDEVLSELNAFLSEDLPGRTAGPRLSATAAARVADA